MAEAILQWVSASVVIIVALVSGYFAVVNRKGGERSRRRDLLPPDWPTMWKRMEEQDDRIDKLYGKVNRISRTFVNYVNRVQTGGDTALTPEEKSLLELDEVDV